MLAEVPEKKPTFAHRNNRHERRVRKGNIRRLAALFSSVLLLLSGILTTEALQGASPAAAAPGDPFSPDEPVVFVAQGTPGTQLYEARANEVTGEWEFEPTGGESEFRYNALGFNRADNYLYAIVENETGTGGFPDRALVRIGQNGEAVNTGFELPSTTMAWSGGFNNDDGYFYLAPANGSTIWVVDVAPSTPTLVRTLTPGAGTPVFDFAYADGHFWGMNGEGISRIDPATGASQFFPQPNWNLGSGDYGAAWVFGNGNLGFSRNGGTVYQVAVEDGSANNPTFTLVGSQPGPNSSRNDGAAIPGLPTDLSIEKDGPERLTPGGVISYDITVTNNGPGVSSGWIVHDPFPSELTNVEVTGPVVSEVRDGQHVVSGGRLEIDESRTFTVTADVSDGATECITNTASILANEEDPNDDNNSDSATACVAELELNKSSDATEDSRPGDDVTYTVTATNTGNVDYTNESPAVVFDDLSGVLDDATYNEDAQASQPGELSYTAPILSWAGALPAGESVDVSYTVELQGGGNGDVRNVAWEPEDPEDGTTPECDPTDADGRDAETGELCAVVQYDLPKLSITKTADRTELPAVGEDVTYSITVTNEGPGDYTATAPATFTDDLTDVIDDADLNEDSLGASAGEVSYDAPTLSWEGPLAAGESADVSYTATYTGAGDQLLVNAACVPEEDLAPGAESCANVSVPGSGLTQWKSVEASDDPVVAGSTLAYTLFFENTGQADAAVDAVDFLTHVLDDAEVTTEPTSSVLSVSRADDEIAITGSIAPGEVATVTYEVTIKDDGARGDDIAVNFLLDNDEDAPPEPPATAECEPVGDFPHCTSTPIGSIEYTKSVESDDDPVVAGSVLTYTVEINSSGAATMPVDRDDVLTDVLDDATLTEDPSSDTSSVTVSEIVNDRFSISGQLAGGQTAVVTYSVTVKDEADRGNNEANNFLVPPGEEPPEECAAGDPECTSTPLPNISVDKNVDPESGSTVVAGQEITYTLEFVNTGNAPGPVDFTDLLDGVLDDAAIISDPVAVSGELEVSPITDEQFTVTGVLDAGATESVTYTAQVLPDGERGDNMLGNFVVPTGTEPPTECSDANPHCTGHFVPQIDSWKTVDPVSDTPVVAGQELTYTLHFENTGAATGIVDKVDDLTHVIDDAEIESEPIASDDAWTVERDGAQISITGDLDAGEAATVSYSVVVKDDDDRGDHLLANFLLDPDEDVPEDPVCRPAENQRPNCTANPVGAILATKTVNPDSGSLVEEGQVLTYTLTFENTGEGAATIDFVDHMSDILDDAELTGEVVTSNGAEVSGPVDEQLHVTGTVAPGDIATVVYTVTVKQYGDQGDHHLGNFLTLAEQTPPDTCLADNPLCTENPVSSPPSPELPRTGPSGLRAGLIAAMLAMSAGTGLILAVRQRTAGRRRL